jgi:hypothetical protein
LTPGTRISLQSQDPRERKMVLKASCVRKTYGFGSSQELGTAESLG